MRSTSFKAAIGEKQKQVEDISKRINLGLERQDIECDVLFDTPEKGRKSFVAVPTGQIVKIEDMTSADYQSPLFDQDERPDKRPGSVQRNRCTSGTGNNRVAGTYGATAPAKRAFYETTTAGFPVRHRRAKNLHHYTTSFFITITHNGEDPMQDYDVVLKLLLRGSAKLLLTDLAGTTVARWLNVELPELVNRRVDLLGETDDETLIQIDLQSCHDKTMALRMAEYALAIYRLFGKFPRQVVLYVGEPPLKMDDTLAGPDLQFRYRLIDVRDLDGERLRESPEMGDNVIALLTRLRDERDALNEFLGKLSDVDNDARAFYLRALLTVAGLRGLEEMVEEEARKMPLLNDILENRVLGREFKRGELSLLRRQIEERFGPIPRWAEDRLVERSAAELEELGVRVLKASTIEELFA